METHFCKRSFPDSAVTSVPLMFCELVVCGRAKQPSVSVLLLRCKLEVSYQQSWNNQRSTYQTGYHKYQGNDFKPSYGDYRQGWGPQSSGSQPGPAVRLEIV